MEKKTLFWNLSVNCTVIAEGNGVEANIVQVIATDIHGNPVSLSIATVDVDSEEKEMVAQGIFDFEY